MHSDLMPQLVFSIVIGIDQPCFSALLHERMRISRLIVTFGSDQIRMYRGKTKRRVRRTAIDCPHQNACRRKRDQEQRRLKTAGAEPEFPSVPKEPQRDARRDK